MFVALILCGGVFALIGWLAFNFSVFALPSFVGLLAARFAYTSGAGFLASGILGLMAGGVSLGLGRFAFAFARSTAMRTAVAGLFTLPAGVAGYWTVYGAVQLCTASEGWRQAFAVAGAVTIAAISYGRFAAFVPLPMDRDARLA